MLQSNVFHYCAGEFYSNLTQVKSFKKHEHKLRKMPSQDWPVSKPTEH